MNSRNLARLLAASLLVATVAHAGPTASQRPAPAVPFECFTSAWDGAFKVIGTRYDKAARRVTWTLEAKKDGPVASYEAFVVDPDGVEVATIKVKLTPAAPKVKAGAKLQAELPLGFTAGDPAKITIRLKR